MEIISQNGKQNNHIGPYSLNQVAQGHSLELAYQLPDESVQSIITSPPYYSLRDYKTLPVYWPAVRFSPMPGLPEICIPEQECSLGLEADIWAFTGHLVALFRELKRALHKTGTLWLNLGDSYVTSPPGNNGKFNEETLGDGVYKRQQTRQLGHGEDMAAIYKKPKELKEKDLMGIPWRVAYALQADGWYLRMDCIWHKPNAMPESTRDRPTKAHEYVFLMSKSRRYFYDQDSIREELADSSWGRMDRKQSLMDRVGTGTLGKQVENGVSQDHAYAGLAMGRNGKTGYNPDGRNRRSVWSIPSQPYPGSHFAVFPPLLIEPMVLASTSEVGHCPECGNGWVRVTEKQKADTTNPRPFSKVGNDDRRDTGRIYEETVTVTTGWQPTCNHNLEPIPAVILDPFFGSGTTGQVSAKHRRYYLGFELNESYLELAPDRVTTQVRLL